MGAAALHAGFAETEPGCGKEFYAYDCDQEAAALWYHAPDRQLFPRI